MFKRMLVPAALLVSAVGFGLTPTASASWLHHNPVERHEGVEPNRYYGGDYGYSKNGYAYSDRSYSNGYPQTYYGQGRYYKNGGSYPYRSAPSLHNGYNNGHRSGRKYRH